jgi:hypothetical protein
VTHIPNKGEQMVRYCGYYSNKSRGMRKKAGADDQLPALVESAVCSKAFRKNWARLIQKIYQIDPLLCPKCQGPMKVISFFFPIIAGLFKIAQHTYIRPLCPLRPTRQDIQHAVCPVWLTHNCAFGILGPTKSKFLYFLNGAIINNGTSAGNNR